MDKSDPVSVRIAELRQVPAAVRQRDRSHDNLRSMRNRRVQRGPHIFSLNIDKHSTGSKPRHDPTRNTRARRVRVDHAVADRIVGINGPAEDLLIELVQAPLVLAVNLEVHYGVSHPSDLLTLLRSCLTATLRIRPRTNGDHEQLPEQPPEQSRCSGTMGIARR